MKKLVTYLVLLIFINQSVQATTYYISSSAGNNSNSTTQAQNKSTPWASAPGMFSASGVVAGYTPQPGDQFIFKGCDVWTNADLPMLWNWNGSSGSHIYIGVDNTWYNTSRCPSSWNRPIFDSGGVGLSILNYYFVGGYAGATNYVDLDNIEMRHLGGSGGAYLAGYEGVSNWTFNHLYLHAQSVALDDGCAFVSGMGASYTNDTFENSVIDGSDATGASPAGGTCYAFYPAIPSIINSVIKGASSTSSTNGLANGIVGHSGDPSPITVAGNLIYNIIESNNGSHPNGFEILGGPQFYVHDNIIHDSQGETFTWGSSGPVTLYQWNNIFYNIPGNNPYVDGRTNSSAALNWYAFNNTVVGSGSEDCFWHQENPGDNPYGVIQIKNNHCINAPGVADGSPWVSATPSLATNLLQTTAQADANVSPNFDQYSVTQTPYVLAPTASTNSTVGVATNLTSSWPAGFSTNDTTYAVAEETIGGVVQAVPQRTAVTRPSSGAWSIGAYELPGTPPPSLTITTTSPLPTGTVGVPYSFTMNATGGVPPYTWSDPACSGACDTGLTFNSSGVWSGSPVNAGTSVFTIQVTDSVSNAVSDPFSITINSAPVNNLHVILITQ